MKRKLTLSAAFVAGWLWGYIFSFLLGLVMWLASGALQQFLDWLAKQDIPWGWVLLGTVGFVLASLILLEVLARRAGRKFILWQVIQAVVSMTTRWAKPRSSTYTTRWHTGGKSDHS